MDKDDMLLVLDNLEIDLIAMKTWIANCRKKTDDALADLKTLRQAIRRIDDNEYEVYYPKK